MSAHHGNEGDVQIGANSVGEVQGWSYDESMDLPAKSSIGDTEETYIASNLTKGGGSIDVLWDETDTTGQGAMTVGATVTLNLYPEGAVSGDTYWTGSAVIASRGLAVTKDGITTRNFAYQGVLTEGTVT